MRLRALSIVACVASGGVAGIPLRAAAGQEGLAQIATPPEITIQSTPVGPMLGDLKGFTLYVTDRDREQGKSTCYGPCAEQWPPLRAEADTKPFGDWSLAPRDDGRPQWAYKGRPLYRYRWEAKPRWAEAQNDVWRYASLNPFPMVGVGRRGFAAAASTVTIVLPPSPGGITGQPSRRGSVFADSRGLTLYSRSTASACTGSCLDSWVPLSAPQAASPVGNWTIVTRDDGTRQWAYQRRPVYRSVKDLKPTDTNGGSDEWQPVLVPSTESSSAQSSSGAPQRPAGPSRSAAPTADPKTGRN
jgi:predicted lipoprotein with Yx(FWY)xxD motif